MKIEELVSSSWESAELKEKPFVFHQVYAHHTIARCGSGKFPGLELLADAVCGRPAISETASDSADSFSASSSTGGKLVEVDDAESQIMMHVKPKRKRANSHQLQKLREVFQQTPFPSADCRRKLAKQLGMTPRSVQIWFQNQRQMARNLVTFK